MKCITLVCLTLFSITCEAQQRHYTLEEVKSVLDSIDVVQIETPCDCSDAMEKVATLMFNATEIFPSTEELFNDVIGLEIVKLTSLKTNEIGKRCEQELRFNDSDIYVCESFKSLEEKSVILNKKFRN